MRRILVQVARVWPDNLVMALTALLGAGTAASGTSYFIDAGLTPGAITSHVRAAAPNLNG